MKLSIKTMRLIAVGASITANCQPCLQTNSAKALEDGISPEEIQEAVEIGKKVRQGAASKMDVFSAGLNIGTPIDTGPLDKECGCGS